MALRIIRKSSSQSQVELIKGSADSKAAFSLLVYLDSAADFEALKALLSHDVLQSAELLLYKSHQFTEQIRSQLPSMPQTAKLINESKPASWSLRLRTGIQEASSEICVFMPGVPTTEILDLVPQLVTSLQQDPSLGMIGPALAASQVLLAAGQDVSVPPHTLAFEGFEQRYQPEDLFYLYRAMPVELWSKLASAPVQTVGVPLALAAIRREAYLSLSWTDQDWNLAWLAQDLALSLRQKQYKLALTPQILNLDEEAQTVLSAGSMPEAFREKWQPVLRQVIFDIYRYHGWKQSGERFQGPLAPSRIQAYLAQKG